MSKVKYRVREYSPTSAQQGSHSFFAEAVIKTMSKKMFALVTGIVGVLQTIGVAVVTYTSPEYATAINSAIVIVGTAVIEACSQFVKAE